jgi:hypothetical protein
MLLRRAHARAVVAEIVCVCAVGNPRDALLVGNAAQHAIQLRLTVVAAVGTVHLKQRVLQLVGGHDAHAHADTLRQLHRLFDFAFGERLRLTDDCHTPLTQHLVGDFDQQRAVHPARQPDDHRAHLAQDGLQLRVLRLQVGRHSGRSPICVASIRTSRQSS